MGVFPSGQRGQTVNLLAMPTVVRIHPPPPKRLVICKSLFYFPNLRTMFTAHRKMCRFFIFPWCYMAAHYPAGSHATMKDRNLPGEVSSPIHLRCIGSLPSRRPILPSWFLLFVLEHNIRTTIVSGRFPAIGTACPTTQTDTRNPHIPVFSCVLHLSINYAFK